MKPTDRFDIRVREGGDSDRGAELVADGDRTPVRLPGAVLEAQFETTHGPLLLMTEDCPYEEALHLVLLDPSLRILDRIEISQPYTPGVVKDIEAQGDDALELSFLGDARWRVEVHPPVRRWRWPSPVAPAVRRRGWPFRTRWLEVRPVAGT